MSIGAGIRALVSLAKPLVVAPGAKENLKQLREVFGGRQFEIFQTPPEVSLSFLIATMRLPGYRRLGTPLVFLSPDGQNYYQLSVYRHRCPKMDSFVFEVGATGMPLLTLALHAVSQGFQVFVGPERHPDPILSPFYFGASTVLKSEEVMTFLERHEFFHL